MNFKATLNQLGVCDNTLSADERTFLGEHVSVPAAPVMYQSRMSGSHGG